MDFAVEKKEAVQTVSGTVRPVICKCTSVNTVVVADSRVKSDVCSDSYDEGDRG